METSSTDIAFISAGSAALGALISQAATLIQTWLERRHKRQILLRTKYEDLGRYFLASLRVAGDLMTMATAKQTASESLAPQAAPSSQPAALLQFDDMNHATLLAAIYFPALRKPMDEYAGALQDLGIAMGQYHNNNPDNVGATHMSQDTAYCLARDKYVAARDNMRSHIEAHAAEYTKS